MVMSNVLCEMCRTPHTSPIKHHQKGFTLIEILVAVAIVAVLATIGLVSYTKAQVIARDGKRKADLRALKVALELYYQANKAYPGPTEWTNSTSASNPWIPGLVTTYINTIPKDPNNSCASTTGNPRDQGCFVYAYYSGTWQNLGGSNPGFILSTRLENIQDPDAGKPGNSGSSTIVQWPEVATPCSYCFTLGNF